MTTNRLVRVLVAISVIVEEIFDYFLRRDHPRESDNSDATQDTTS